MMAPESTTRAWYLGGCCWSVVVAGAGTEGVAAGFCLLDAAGEALVGEGPDQPPPNPLMVVTLLETVECASAGGWREASLAPSIALLLLAFEPSSISWLPVSSVRPSVHCGPVREVLVKNSQLVPAKRRKYRTNFRRRKCERERSNSKGRNSAWFVDTSHISFGTISPYAFVGKAYLSRRLPPPMATNAGM